MIAGRTFALLALALLLALPAAGAAQAAGKARPKPQKSTPAAVASAAPLLPPPPAYPARLDSFPCKPAAAAAATPGVADPAAPEPGKVRQILGSLGHGITSVTDRTRSTVGDRFSIRGKDGVFLCRPTTAARLVADQAPSAATDGKALAMAGFADVKGSTSPQLLTMPSTEAKLQRIVNRIASAWPYPDAPKAVVKLGAQSSFNARAYPDNVIVVNVGIFMAADGEGPSEIKDNDLYWILGHEYSHLALKHNKRGDALRGQLNALNEVATVYMEGAKVNSALHYAEGSSLDKDLRARIEDGKSAHDDLRFAIERVLHPIWGRANEDEADAAGFDLAASLGYFPRIDVAAARFESTEKTGDDMVAGVQTEVSGRLAASINDPRFGSALNQGQAGAAFSSLGAAVKNGLTKGVRDLLIGWFSRDHRLAKSRREGLTEYRQAAYAKPDALPEPKIYEGDIAQVLDTDEMREAQVVTRGVEAADAAMSAGDLPKARLDIAKPLATRYRRESLVLFTAARVSDRSGDRPTAIRYLESARSAPTTSPDAYRMLSKFYAQGGKLDTARIIVAEGRRKTGDSDFFLPEDVRIAARGRDLTTVATLLDTCRATERERIGIECFEAAMDVDWDKLSDAQKTQLADLARYGASGRADVKSQASSFASFLAKPMLQKASN